MTFLYLRNSEVLFGLNLSVQDYLFGLLVALVLDLLLFLEAFLTLVETVSQWFFDLPFYPFVLLMILIKLVCLLIAIAYFTLAERKIMAAAQRRFGPNVVGYWGLLQPLADGLKLFAKELVIPTHANSRLFIAAPMAVLSLAFIAWSVIPFSVFDHSEISSFCDLGQSVFGSVKDPSKVETVLQEVTVTNKPSWARGWSNYILGETVTQYVVTNPKKSIAMVAGASLLVASPFIGYTALYVNAMGAANAAAHAAAAAQGAAAAVHMVPTGVPIATQAVVAMAEVAKATAAEALQVAVQANAMYVGATVVSASVYGLKTIAWVSCWAVTSTATGAVDLVKYVLVLDQNMP